VGHGGVDMRCMLVLLWGRCLYPTGWHSVGWECRALWSVLGVLAPPPLLVIV